MRIPITTGFRLSLPTLLNLLSKMFCGKWCSEAFFENRATSTLLSVAKLRNKTAHANYGVISPIDILVVPFPTLLLECLVAARDT